MAELDAATPLAHGVIGELFYKVPDAVVITVGDRIRTVNAPGLAMFGFASDEHRPLTDLSPVFGSAYDELLALLADGGQATLRTGPRRTDLLVEASSWQLTGSADTHVLLLRDVTAEARLRDGLADINRLGRELLVGELSLQEVLQRLVTAAKEVTSAAFSALLLVRAESAAEVTHFVYDAPRELFPERLPRTVGLLAVPLASRAPARLDDIRGHPAGVGIPGVHPPIGALLAVPLLVGDQAIGEVAVANQPGEHTFHETDETLVAELAAQGALAVRIAQQRERDEESRARRQDVTDAARHDIRTPVGAGKGYLKMLEQRWDDMSGEQRTTAIDAVRGCLDRVESFAQRLLLDEHLELAGLQPAWSLVGISPMLDAIARDHTVGNERGVSVVVGAEEGVDVIAAEAKHARDVLDNLVSNAVKASPTDGVVTVTARHEGSDFVRFDVRNTGEGISASDQARLFQRFSRTEQSIRANVPGTGLGLSIVRRLVEAHGGSVGVSSRASEGTTFWVTFPVAMPISAPGESS